MPVLGCIADDFTGGTDLAGNLAQRGFRVVQLLGLPDPGQGAEDALADADAVVIALKSRTVPVDQAVSVSLAALDVLRAAGCERYYFKYCSTFDSTPHGNIGPVAAALADALDAPATVFCPAFPEAGRTLYQGHLFVNGDPLHESGMRDHPLTPMTDSNLVRWLSGQTARPVGLVPWQTVRTGTEAVRARIADLRAEGVEAILTDALDNDDLRVLGKATGDLALITGGSGLALGLDAPNGPRSAAFDIPTAPDGPRAILAGSASSTTRAQVAHAKEHYPSVKLDVAALHRDYSAASAALIDACRSRLGDVPLLVYSVETRADLDDAQTLIGAQAAGELVERALADLAAGLCESGVRSLIVAGGETSGAVAARLGVHALRIGPQVAPGVPWTAATRGHDVLNLVLKSGNFGPIDMFTTAWELR